MRCFAIELCDVYHAKSENHHVSHNVAKNRETITAQDESGRIVVASC